MHLSLAKYAKTFRVSTQVPLSWVQATQFSKPFL